MRTLQIMLIALLAQNPALHESKNASIEGFVVQLGTRLPVSRVTVQLSRVEGGARRGAPQVFSITTSADGRFAFQNLPAGGYRLAAERSGGSYYPAEYGQQNWQGPGTVISLAAGQQIKNARLEMTATGSISGRVVDVNGEPAGRVRVLALEAVYRAGRREFRLVQAMNTNDLGEYRLFWLPPGRYYIAAKPEDPLNRAVSLVISSPGHTRFSSESYNQSPVTRRTLDNGDVVEETYELVYYGGGTDARSAQPIDLEPGANAGPADISLAGGRVRARSIRGIVIDGVTGRPASAAVRAVPRDLGPSIVAPNSSSGADGSFEITGLGSGAHFLVATVNGGERTGVVLLEPGGGDVQNVRVVTTPGFSISGRVEIRGHPASGELGMAGLRIGLDPDNGFVSPPESAVPSVNGSFALRRIQPGNYRIFVDPILTESSSEPPGVPDAYVESIRLGGVDVLSGGVHIRGGSDGDLVIVIGANGGALEGRVMERPEKPAQNETVVLVPDWTRRDRSDLFKTATADAEGRFRLQGIAPGDYKVFAWKYVPDGVWHDPEFMRAQETRGTPIHTGEGGKENIDVTVIPPLR